MCRQELLSGKWTRPHHGQCVADARGTPFDVTFVVAFRDVGLDQKWMRIRSLGLLNALTERRPCCSHGKQPKALAITQRGLSKRLLQTQAAGLTRPLRCVSSGSRPATPPSW